MKKIVSFLHHHPLRVVVSCYLIIQLVAIFFVGFTWDEPSMYFVGVRTWQHFRQLPPTDDISFSHLSIPEDGPYRYAWGAKHYPSLLPTISLISAKFFHETLDLIPRHVAHHLPLVFFGSLGVYAVGRIALLAGLGPIVAVITSLLYGLYPTIIGQMRNDVKDAPLAASLAIMVWGLFEVYHRLGNSRNASVRLLVVLISTGVAIGVALAVKMTAVFTLLAVVVFTLTLVFFPSGRKRIFPLPRSMVSILIVILLAGSTLYLSWPSIWIDPVKRILENLDFFSRVGYGLGVLYWGHVYQAGINLPWHYPWVILFSQTPPTLMLLLFVGVGYSWWLAIRKRDPLPLFFSIWFAVVLGRFLYPGMIIYAKVRHIIDSIVPLSILAGYGVVAFNRISVPIGNRRLYVGLVIGLIAIAHSAWISIRFFPYEPSYFSELVGGIKSADKEQISDIEYWGSSVFEAVNWLQKTDSSAVIYACGMGHLAKYYISGDMRVTGNALEATYIILPNSPSYFGAALTSTKENHQRVHTIQRNGTDLLYVFQRNFANPIWQCGPESEEGF